MPPSLSTSPDHVRTPLAIDFPRIGTVRPRSATEIGPSNWTLGCETLDRDFADWDEYKDYIPPLGLKTIHLQSGWAKCERVKGTYDFAWLDHIVDDAIARGIEPILERPSPPNTRRTRSCARARTARRAKWPPSSR